MPRFFFDIHDGTHTRDDEGVVLPDMSAVRAKAMTILPKIAADEIEGDSDRHHFTVLVSDEDGKAIYSATLTYTGVWLLR